MQWCHVFVHDLVETFKGPSYAFPDLFINVLCYIPSTTSRSVKNLYFPQLGGFREDLSKIMSSVCGMVGLLASCLTVSLRRTYLMKRKVSWFRLRTMALQPPSSVGRPSLSWS